MSMDQTHYHVIRLHVAAPDGANGEDNTVALGEDTARAHVAEQIAWYADRPDFDAVYGAWLTGAERVSFADGTTFAIELEDHDGCDLVELFDERDTVDHYSR